MATLNHTSVLTRSPTSPGDTLKPRFSPACNLKCRTASSVEIDGLGVGNLDPGALDGLEAQAVRFWIANAETLEAATESGEYDLEQAGRDLWFTRNGHGVGFWGRDFGDIGDALTEACQYDEIDLFAVPLDLETGEPLPGYHVDHATATDAEPDPDNSDAWRVFLSMPDTGLTDVERAALAALEGDADAATVARVMESVRETDAAYQAAQNLFTRTYNDSGDTPEDLPVRLERDRTFRDNDKAERDALDVLEPLRGEPVAEPLADVGGQSGARMGRRGDVLDGDAGPITARRVTLDSGGYDAGGAYWGVGQSLWRVMDADGATAFLRADNAREAIREAWPVPDGTGAGDPMNGGTHA
ncbi:hypothetical protein ACM25O_13350 [Sulfitobacter pontiacus]